MSGTREIGCTSEALIAAAFASGLTITAQRAALLIGCDVRTLRHLTDGGLIRSVRRGKLRAYTEANIRSYLLDSPAAENMPECPSTSQSKARSGSSTSSSKVVGITARLASTRNAPPKRSSARSARTPPSVVFLTDHR